MEPQRDAAIVVDNPLWFYWDVRRSAYVPFISDTETKMQNGLYAAEFQTPFGNGYGVVMLLNGVLQGGDSMMYYRGNYTIDGNGFKADVKTNVHAHPPGMASVFGRDRVTISLAGTFAGDTLTANGKAAEVPNVDFSAKLKLIAVGS